MTVFAETFELLDRVSAPELTGRVVGIQGLTVRVAGLYLPVGAGVHVEAAVGVIGGEVVGLDRELTLVMLLGDTSGIRRGDRVRGAVAGSMIAVGEGLLGRVIDGLGRPIDGKGPVLATAHRPIRGKLIEPMSRVPIREPMGTGVRAIDAMLTVGRGQRLGIFSASGVGKSTLLSTIARHAAGDVSVIALIGERGREVGDFVRQHLGAEGLARSVVVAATADEPALMRIRAAWLGCAVAEHFRDGGMDVALIMDSVTRFAQSQRQVGLAAGEPPAARGYPPSVFAALPMLLERAGVTGTGSITGFYAVLVEGDDAEEPIADGCRSLLDGHVVLARELAEGGHYPAIDVVRSVSRVQPQVVDEPHRLARQQVATLIAAYRKVEELLKVGAYVAGSDPLADVAIEMRGQIDGLLRQGTSEAFTFHESKKELLRVAAAAAQLAVRNHRRANGVAAGP